MKWVGNCLTGCTQSVVINVFTQAGSLSQAGSPQGSALGLTLFSISLNDLGNGIEGTITNVADDAKLGGEVDASEEKNHLTKTWTGWKREQARTVQSYTERSARSCTMDDAIKEPRAGWDLRGWGAALLTGSWGPGGQQAEQESAVHRCSHQGKSLPGLHLQGRYWQTEM